MTETGTPSPASGTAGRVGVVGLGVMGAALARRLAGQGASVVATSRSERSRAALADTAGVDVVATPADVAAALTQSGTAAGTPDGAPAVVLVSVTAGPQVRDVVLGGHGLLDGVPDGARIVLVDTSTCDPRDARSLSADLAARGHGVLDAPVSGGPSAIAAGTLSVMAGGAAADLDAVRPVLDLFAGTVVHCGAAGAGQVAKACNQLVVACTLEAVAEALVLAEACGVAPADVRTALLGGYASSRVLDLAGDRMVRGDRTLVGSAALFAKDAGIILGLGQDTGVPLPALTAVAEQLRALADRDPGADHSTIVELLRRPAPPP